MASTRRWVGSGQYCAANNCINSRTKSIGKSFFRFPKEQTSRDHPDVIKFRFLRIGFVCLLMLPVLWSCSTNSHSIKSRVLLTLVGIRANGFVMATILPYLLTTVLFLGPLSLHYLDGVFKIYFERRYWAHNLQNLIWLRNHVVAPISEEFMFRACMLPLLVPSFGESRAMLICPLFFGVAHFHHLAAELRKGTPFRTAAMQSVFQFFYTTFFGVYSAFLFLRTGHLIAPAVVHGFCNHMGFPDFNQVLTYRQPKRLYVSMMFFIGLVLWLVLLYPLTQPALYANDLYDI